MHLTEKEFKQWNRADSYWDGRWQYIQPIITITRIVLHSSDVLNPSILEVKTHGKRLFSNSETMDYRAWGQEPTYKQQIFNTWPDKDWDLVIALHAFEMTVNGTGNNQRATFRNIMEHTDHAIVCFPIDQRSNHYHQRRIGLSTIKDWSLGIDPVSDIIISGLKPRYIGYWNFT